MILNAKELAILAKHHGARQVVETLQECFELHRTGQPGGVNPEDFSLRDLYEHTVPDGREALSFLNPRHQVDSVLEANVDTTLFSNITGQLVITRILEGFNNGDYVFSQLIPNLSTSFLDGEKIPGMAQLGDQAEVVAEAGAYPETAFGEEYIETPATEKRGNIVPLTKEAVFADRTRLILDRASGVGEFLGLNKEKRLAKVALGVVNNYKRNGTAVDTYQIATPWINKIANLLVDWTDIEAIEHLFAAMVDPNTSESISIRGMDLVTTAFKHRTAQRILGATEVRHTADSLTTNSDNPVRRAYTPHASNVMYGILTAAAVSAANAKEYHVLGNFKKAFGYMEAFPLTTTQMPSNSYRSFKNDIVTEYKASERGVAVVLEPRYVALATNV